nr:photoreceptor ankyrin repeat protein-like [Zonotrichia albicollis]
MKAAVQGRQDCVTALLLAGADLQAVDAVKGKTAREWATFTGRFETTVRIRSLLRRPRAEQFAAQYQPEWPALAELVAKALSPKSRSKRLSEKIRSIFTFNIPRNPEEDGVLDHMVRMTTAMGSPFVATACQTVCPDSPPEVGKRRLSVQEILGQHVKASGSASGERKPRVKDKHLLQPPQWRYKVLKEEKKAAEEAKKGDKEKEKKKKKKKKKG